MPTGPGAGSLPVMANRQLDRVLTPEYLEGLVEWPIDAIRSRRAECQRLEDAASYLRRLVQTRIDIIGLELRGRADGDEGDLVSLIEKLPSILSEQTDRRGAVGRLVSVDPGDDQEAWAEARVELACGRCDVESAPELSEAELNTMADNLAALERTVSEERRRLHDILDLLQNELVHRYKTGQATVEGLLK